jgi:hypothetical protein
MVQMTLKTLLLATALTVCATGSFAQTRNYQVHFDGSCMGMTLHITNGLNVVGDSVGCGDTKRAYVGRIDPGDVANVHSTNAATELVTLNYKIGLRDNTWVLSETLDGKTEEIGNGYWTKQGPVVEVKDIPNLPPPNAPAPPPKP